MARVFDRLSQRARFVLVHAQQEARALSHDCIGAEHLLLGVMREEESAAARVLESLGITHERAHTEVARIAGTGERPGEGQMPLTPEARKVLELALREALGLECDRIEPEHLLLGLLLEDEGATPRVLANLGAEAEQVACQLYGTLGHPPAGGPLGDRRWPPEPTFERFTEPARQVTLLAREEARLLGHRNTGAEHILLGLLRQEEGLAARVLESLGITIEAARRQVAEMGHSGAQEGTGPPSLDEEGKRVLAIALREAFSLGHVYVGTEHLLLALPLGKGVVARVLAGLDANSAHIRDEVIGMLAGPGARRRRKRGQERHDDGVLPAALTEGACGLIEKAAREVERNLDRPADAGDVLVALACVPEGLTRTVLAALGIDRPALVRALDEARDARADGNLTQLGELEARLRETREEKFAKIEADEFEDAADLYDSERQLTLRVRYLRQQRAEEALAELRALVRLQHH